MIWGQRCSVWLVSRCHNEVWVEVGILAMTPSCPGPARAKSCRTAWCRSIVALLRHNKIMIPSSPFVIILSADELHELTSRARGARAAHRDVVRATIILAAGEGVSNARIAADLGLHIDTVRKWRRRFWQRRLRGLADLPRSDRPAGSALSRSRR